MIVICHTRARAPAERTTRARAHTMKPIILPTYNKGPYVTSGGGGREGVHQKLLLLHHLPHKPPPKKIRVTHFDFEVRQRMINAIEAGTERNVNRGNSISPLRVCACVCVSARARACVCVTEREKEREHARFRFPVSVLSLLEKNYGCLIPAQKLTISRHSLFSQDTFVWQSQTRTTRK